MTDTPTTLLALCGGLDKNQLVKTPSVRDYIVSRCPWVMIRQIDDVGYEWGNIPNIESAIAKVKTENPSIVRVVAVGHSMGWITIKHAALAGLLDYMIALDPVGVPFVSKDMWPIINGIKQPGDFCKANPTPFITQLYVSDGPEIRQVDCGHNELAHRQEVFDAVLAAVKG